jgi:hypothetical protein
VQGREKRRRREDERNRVEWRTGNPRERKRKDEWDLPSDILQDGPILLLIVVVRSLACHIEIPNFVSAFLMTTSNNKRQSAAQYKMNRKKPERTFPSTSSMRPTLLEPLSVLQVLFGEVKV